ncbi:cytochrome P450 [Whalleya microplaca]|nr:cytochrome P450 [Whalleya microplaca]
MAVEEAFIIMSIIAVLLIIGAKSFFMLFEYDKSPWFRTQKPSHRFTIPQVPSLPILGSLIQIGHDHVRNLRAWAQEYGPIFFIRLGNRRLVIANSPESIKYLWLKHHDALISRPRMHTFHDVAADGKNFTIGSSPWSDSCKLLRKIVARNSSRSAIQAHVPVIDFFTTEVIARLFQDGCASAQDLDPGAYIHEYSINVVLRLYFGTSLHYDDQADAELMRKIIYSEREMAKLRSMGNNWQDYLPLLRLWPVRDFHATKLKKIQDEFMDTFFERLQRDINAGVSEQCVVGDILNSEESQLSRTQIKTLCLSTIGASVLSVPGNLIMAIAWLSSVAGQTTQQHIWEDIQANYPNGDAWERVVYEEKVASLTAFMKESLRYFSSQPLSLSRQSVKDIEYAGATIPAGTEFHMNAWAANHDSAKYDRPFVLQPDRFLRRADEHTVDGKEKEVEHFSFGVGSRMCPGMHLGNRMLYAMLARLILAYRVLPATEEKDLPELNALECRLNRNDLALDPKPFKCGFEPRGSPDLGRIATTLKSSAVLSACE